MTTILARFFLCLLLSYIGVAPNRTLFFKKAPRPDFFLEPFMAFSGDFHLVIEEIARRGTTTRRARTR